AEPRYPPSNLLRRATDCADPAYARRHAAHHPRHRSGWHGRRSDHHAGPVHLPVPGRRRQRQTDRRIQTLGPAPEIHRTGGLFRPRQGAAGDHVMMEILTSYELWVGLGLILVVTVFVLGKGGDSKRMKARLERVTRKGPRVITTDAAQTLRKRDPNE